MITKIWWNPGDSWDRRSRTPGRFLWLLAAFLALGIIVDSAASAQDVGNPEVRMPGCRPGGQNPSPVDGESGLDEVAWVMVSMVIPTKPSQGEGNDSSCAFAPQAPFPQASVLKIKGLDPSDRGIRLGIGSPGSSADTPGQEGTTGETRQSDKQVRKEESQYSRNLASPYVPLDSWVYPDLERLASLGYIHTEFLGMRPWTRDECARLTAEAGENLAEAESPARQANRIYDALAGEFAPELHPVTEQSRSLQVESLYTRLLGISGQPLNDSYHFGQTLINDFGRPYAEGFNPVSGFSGWTNWERFALYMRGEYQHSPSAPGYSQGVQDLIAQIDDTPVQPARPVPTINQFRLLDTYALTKLGNWDFSFGKQSLWWGPGEGGALLFSDNAEPIYMFRTSRDAPFTLPWIFHALGPAKLDAFFGKLSGNEFPPRPLLHGEKISFKPTPNLELGITRTTEFGGVGRALTPLAIFRSYFSAHSSDLYPANANPGKRAEGLEVTYKLPRLRNWLTLYYDGLDPFANPTNFDMSKSPLDAPRRAATRAGLYAPRLPHLHKLDLRVEAVYTDPPTPRSHAGEYVYWNDHYHDLYTNKGNIIGDWIGREGKGYQGSSTYWFSPRTSLQVGYRHAQVASDFIPHGETLNDGSVKLNWLINDELTLSAFVQYERWLAPVLAPAARNNVTAALQFTFWPRHWVWR